MTTRWENDYFFRRDKLKKAIEVYDAAHGNYTFPASMGLRLARLDIEWWSHLIKNPVKKHEFMVAAKKLISGKKFERGMDVPRGVDIEHLYYKIDKGYSDAQYGAHLSSYD